MATRRRRQTKMRKMRKRTLGRKVRKTRRSYRTKRGGNIAIDFNSYMGMKLPRFSGLGGYDARNGNYLTGPVGNTART